MAAPLANTYTTKTAVGVREDLANIIAQVDKVETPLYSMARKTNVTGKRLHEWQEWDVAAVAAQVYLGAWADLTAYILGDFVSNDGVIYECIQAHTSAAANDEPGVGTNEGDYWSATVFSAGAMNYRAEGEDLPTGQVPTETVRYANPTSIFIREYLVSGTLASVDVAGRPGELAWQAVNWGMELRRDIELALCRNIAKQTTEPQIMAGLPTWADGEDGTALNALTPAHGAADVDTAMGVLFAAGVRPNAVLMLPANKNLFSKSSVGGTAPTAGGVEAGVTERHIAEIPGSVSVYLSDVGPVNMVVSNYLDATLDASFILDSRRIRVAEIPGRKFVNSPLASTGDARRRQVLWEGTLEATSPKSIATVV